MTQRVREEQATVEYKAVGLLFIKGPAFPPPPPYYPKSFVVHADETLIEIST